MQSGQIIRKTHILPFCGHFREKIQMSTFFIFGTWQDTLEINKNV